MTELTEFDWRDLGTVDGYLRWRRAKIAGAERARTFAPVEIQDLALPSEIERDEIMQRCRVANYALYSSAGSVDDAGAGQAVLRDFASAFGLKAAEAHRSADFGDVVALQVSQDSGKRGYIPYSDRSMNWHTDGYYNAPDQRIGAFILHCVRPAQSGGHNDILDPEIAYIRLRDQNPDFIRALMHPQAMTIPENKAGDGSSRPASVGPVFFGDMATGRLQMRYTARTRSISWRDDALTVEAAGFLRQCLASGDPLAQHIALAPGHGILCNNVLHNRSGFDDGPNRKSARLVYRIRFHRRVGGR